MHSLSRIVGVLEICGNIHCATAQLPHRDRIGGVIESYACKKPLDHCLEAHYGLDVL
jgi:hypothetical protein